MSQILEEWFFGGSPNPNSNKAFEVTSYIVKKTIPCILEEEFQPVLNDVWIKFETYIFIQLVIHQSKPSPPVWVPSNIYRGSQGFGFFSNVDSSN